MRGVVAGARQLLLVGVCVVGGVTSSCVGTSPRSSESVLQLILESWTCVEAEEGWLVAEGAVTNVGGSDLSGLSARIRFYDAQGTLLLDELCSVEPDVLLPSERGEFRCEYWGGPEFDQSSVVFLVDDRQVAARPR